MLFRKKKFYLSETADGIMHMSICHFSFYNKNDTYHKKVIVIIIAITILTKVIIVIIPIAKIIKIKENNNNNNN